MKDTQKKNENIKTIESINKKMEKIPTKKFLEKDDDKKIKIWA